MICDEDASFAAPSHRLAHKAGDIAKYGNEDIKILAQHFGSQQIDKDEVTAEYKQYFCIVL